MKKDKWERFLARNGVTYMFPRLKVWQYSVANLAMAILVVFIAIRLSTGWSGSMQVIFCTVAFVMGCRILHLLIRFSNRCDNDAMLEDMKRIYDTLRIQCHAGVFLNDSLVECYLLVRNRRLKSAMLELVNQISTRNQIDTAVEGFQAHFHCNAMDTLCIIIKQSLQSGQASQILSDVSSQLTYLQHALSMKEKARMERKVEVLELMIYLGVMGIGLFVLGNEFEQVLTM